MDPHEAQHVLRTLPSAIAPPPDRAHRAVLVAILVDLSQQAVALLHAGLPPTGCACHRVAWAHLGALTRSIDEDPRSAFADWIDAVCGTFSAAHPQAPGARAAALMRADPARAWSMATLARHVRVPTLRLRRDFHARFGMRASRYLQLVRAARAVALLGTDRKVEAVAWEVGYRSKKDLYTALRRWAGGSPSAVRALPGEEREWLERVLVRQSIKAGGPRRRSVGHTPRPRQRRQR
jgi:AraC-like DNA-binding protein